jgi:hypothetical protein
VLPQPVRNSNRLDAGGFPPRRLIAVPVNLTMMGAAERHGKLIANFAAQRARLHESEMMRFGRLPPAPKTRL